MLNNTANIASIPAFKAIAINKNSTKLLLKNFHTKCENSAKNKEDLETDFFGKFTVEDGTDQYKQSDDFRSNMRDYFILKSKAINPHTAKVLEQKTLEVLNTINKISGEYIENDRLVAKKGI